VVIASRQHALLVMMHEGSHYRISKDIFYNDLISDNLAAYPLLLTTSAYRKNHLAHHKHTNTAQDPDWARKIISPEWQYPQTKSRILQTMWKQFINGPRDWIMLTYSVTKTDSFRHLIFWGLGLTIVTGFGIWKEFAMYWMAPLFFVLPVLQRTRSITEHFGLSRTHELNQTRNIESTAFERFIFAPHRVSYHLTHHMFPSIPHYYLKDFNEELKKYLFTNKTPMLIAAIFLEMIRF
jgi:fatty acid desaturase